jgi:hypothetical protein
MEFKNTIFDTISSASSTGAFGGAIEVESAGILTFDTCTGQNFYAKQTNSSNGGGSFLYSEFDGLFTLKIISSTFKT